jgi:acyl-CoA reductase-like NAD-dependent aldehyde dehydrogenase
MRLCKSYICSVWSLWWIYRKTSNKSQWIGNRRWFSEAVTIGPLVDDSSLEKVEIHILDAIDKGSKVIIGEKRKEAKGRFFQPTVMTEMSKDMKIAKEETFGPVAPIFRFETVDDVIFQANDTEFGLAPYFYANDLTKVWRLWNMAWLVLTQGSFQLKLHRLEE